MYYIPRHSLLVTRSWLSSFLILLQDNNHRTCHSILQPLDPTVIHVHPSFNRHENSQFSQKDQALITWKRKTSTELTGRLQLDGNWEKTKQFDLSLS